MADGDGVFDVIEIGAGPVGESAADAVADGTGRHVRAVEIDMASTPGAEPQAGGYTGRAKAVVDEDRVLLGVTIAGPGVNDYLHAGHRRGDRRGAAGPAVARRGRVPGRERVLAVPPTGVRPVRTWAGRAGI